jgi:hypothetical protein
MNIQIHLIPLPWREGLGEGEVGALNNNTSRKITVPHVHIFSSFYTLPLATSPPPNLPRQGGGVMQTKIHPKGVSRSRH